MITTNPIAKYNSGTDANKNRYHKKSIAKEKKGDTVVLVDTNSPYLKLYNNRGEIEEYYDRQKQQR